MDSEEQKEHTRVMELIAKCDATNDVKQKLLAQRHKNRDTDFDVNFDETWQILNDLYESYKKQI